MIISPTAEPQILFYFEGIVAFCAAEGRSHFDVGIVKGVASNEEIPFHTHSIEITKWKEGQKLLDFSPVRFDIRNPARILRLEVLTQSQSGVLTPGLAFFRPASGATGSNRTDNYSFDWVVDVERELHDSRVIINDKALRSVLRVIGMEKGTFFTESVSEGPLFTKDQNGRVDSLGQGAESVIALTPLPSGGASLQKFDEKSRDYEEVCRLTHEEGVIYQIEVKNTCEPAECNSDVTGFYNDLIVGSVDGDRRVRFITPPLPQRRLIPETTPQTQCECLNFGISENLPDPA